MQMNQCNYLSFIAPLPTSPVDVQTAEPTLGDISIVSQSVTNNRCAPSCGGHKGKVGGGTPPTCKLLPTPLMYTDYREGHLSRKEYLQCVSYRFSPA